LFSKFLSNYTYRRQNIIFLSLKPVYKARVYLVASEAWQSAVYGNSADNQDKYLTHRKLLIIISVRYNRKKSRVFVLHKRRTLETFADQITQVLLLGLVYGFTKLISKQYGKRLNN
jgi:hypothetical protein